uniref:Uncharacterized protein n=1 Tax=Populus trichocarpa TaxID=3694 RepID=A9PDR1_POPTR|nr:unknown [Populus trichocarpa]
MFRSCSFSGSGFLFLALLQRMNKAPITTNTKSKLPKRGSTIKITSLLLFLLTVVLLFGRLHGFRPLALPHIPILSLNASNEALWKALISGMGPCSLLDDISTVVKLNMSLKVLGIRPESML